MSDPHVPKGLVSEQQTVPSGPVAHPLTERQDKQASLRPRTVNN
jgi:hypothetical protein